MKNLKNERGSVTVLVIITLITFAMILASAFAVASNLHRDEMQSDTRVKKAYNESNYTENHFEITKPDGTKTMYNTLQEAFSAVDMDVANTTEVKMLRNEMGDVTLEYGKNVMLNLNGFTYSGSIINNGVLTIDGRNLNTAGKIVAVEKEVEGPVISNTGTFFILGQNLKIENDLPDSNEVGYAIPTIENKQSGSMYIQGGHFKTSQTTMFKNYGSLEIDSMIVEHSAPSSGKDYATFHCVSGTTTISDKLSEMDSLDPNKTLTYTMDITTAGVIFRNEKDSTLEIKKGNYTSSQGYALVNGKIGIPSEDGGTVNIEGGVNFTTTTSNLIYNKGTFTMKNTVLKSVNGAADRIQSPQFMGTSYVFRNYLGTVNMIGGLITGSGSPTVYNDGGTFNFLGGTISNSNDGYAVENHGTFYNNNQSGIIGRTNLNS